jgi:putative colanic acid biosynthesis UDP-glucose lipid carrier transferase
MILVFPFYGLYRSWRGTKLWREVWSVSLAWVVVLLLFNGLILVLAEPEQRQLLLPFCLFGVRPFWIWAICTWALLTGYRIVLRLMLRYLRKKGYNTRTAVVFGSGDLGRKVHQILMDKRWIGIRVVGFFDDNPALHQEKVSDVEVMGNLEQGVEFVQRQRIDTVFITLPFRSEQRIKQISSALKDTTATCYLVPDLFNLQLFSMSLFEIAGLPLLDMNATNLTSAGNRVLKWLEDVIVSILILFLITPLMIVIAIAIMATSNGPVIFKQRRYGMNGDEIVVYKFRTMTVCEDGDVVPQAREGDQRVTAVGRFLRRTSLDELPQFINVLQGRMSVVGPRPHAVAHNETYRKLIDGYMLRHKVKPGITGWAQINGWRGETETLEKMARRVEHDLYYLRNWSLWLDLKIILISIFVGFAGKRAY